MRQQKEWLLHECVTSLKKREWRQNTKPLHFALKRVWKVSREISGFHKVLFFHWLVGPFQLRPRHESLTRSLRHHTKAPFACLRVLKSSLLSMENLHCMRGQLGSGLLRLRRVRKMWSSRAMPIRQYLLRACLHGGGGPQIGEVIWGGSPHLSCKISNYMDV